VMERASFSLERQAPARTRTFILSTLREMEGLQGQQPCARSIFLVEHSLRCVSSHLCLATTRHPLMARSLL
jgi:hypothetical protein